MAAAGLVIAGAVVTVIDAVPVADGVNTVVPTAVPLTLMVVGLNVPATVEVGVITSFAGHWPLVGVNVSVTGLPDAPVVADNASV